MTSTSRDVSEAAATVANGIGRFVLGDLIRRSARRFADKIALYEHHRTTTYAQLDAGSNQFAHELKDRGLAAGSRIITLCANSSAYVMVIFGINKAGHVWVPVNTNLVAHEIEFIIRHCEGSLIVIDRALAERDDVKAMLATLALPSLAIDPQASDPFLGGLSGRPTTEFHIPTHERDLALIMYTSGTTAKPKGVMHCHLAVYVTMLNNIGEWSVTREDRILIGLPLFHCSGHVMVTVLLAAGGSVVLRSGFDAEDCVDAIMTHRVTMLFALPRMYDGMLRSVRAGGADTSSLRFCIYAMAPMPKPLLEELIADFCPQFALTSGQTEIYPMTVMFRPEQQLQRFGNYWGESAAINDTAIMDDDGNLLPSGQVGEIVHRGPNVMLGYYRDPEATAKVQRFGWHHTGDLGFFDPDGQLVFADRQKDMIKSGGENVPSVLVEEVMLRHPAVANAAVVGLPHPHWIEAVVAFVTLRPGAEADANGLLAHARAHLSGFQVPKGIMILEAIPMTVSGKCRKSELRQQFRDHFAA